MATNDAALVLVLPDDDIKSITRKVRATVSGEVHILVPEDVSALQEESSFDELLRAIDPDKHNLLIISSDKHTLAAARQHQIETIGVEGTRISVPAPMPLWQEEDGAVPSAPPTPAVATPPVAAEVDADDADFLRSLEEAPPAPAAAADEDDPYAAFDDFSAVVNAEDARRRGEPAEDDPYAAFDDLSDAFASEMDDGQERAAAAPAPRARIRPEDIELSSDEKRRAAKVRPYATSSYGDTGAAPQVSHAAQRERSLPYIPILVAALVGLLLLAMIVLLRAVNPATGGDAATVVVNTPSGPSQSRTIENEPIARAQVGATDAQLAVQAEEIVSTVTVTETGRVEEEDLTPSAAARGIITLYNTSSQPINLPQGTEFVATNPEGNEVTFVSDAAVTVPAASAGERQGAQIVQQLGTGEVTVTARAAGSAGNVEDNTVTRFQAPGQEPVSANIGVVLVEHGPLAGGTEEPIRVVKDSNAQEVLGAALTSLNNRARQILEQEVASRGGLSLEVETIVPNAEDLSAGEGYNVQIFPPVGEQVDPANPVFNVVIQGEFSALATPEGSSLQEQLQNVLPQQLDQAGRLPFGMTTEIMGWEWDGTMLTVDGRLQPTGERAELSDQQVSDMINAIRGQPTSEAAAALDEFIQRGIIVDYELPEDMTVLPENIEIEQQ